MPYSQVRTMLDGVTSSQSSAAVAVADRSKMSLQILATAISSGNGVFKVWVSNDGTNFVQYNRLTDNVVNSISEGDVRVASATLSTNSNKIYFFPPGDLFKYVNVAVTRTTDGTYSAFLCDYSAE